VPTPSYMLIPLLVLDLEVRLFAKLQLSGKITHTCYMFLRGTTLATGQKYVTKDI
jgi:hypothetical protein